MNDKTNIMNLLHSKRELENKLNSLLYGSVEIRENKANKYIYVHYRKNGFQQTKYAGEYSEEMCNQIISNTNEAKEIKRKIRKIKKELQKLNYNGERKQINLTNENKQTNIEKYEIKKWNEDFIFTNEINNKGTRYKRTVIDINKRKAIFKYQMYNCSEACSEKISYEIAKTLGYKCAEIELATDENNTLGILNYLFINKKEGEHIDAIAYIKKDKEKRKDFYTLNNIKKSLDILDKNLFNKFIEILIFDALVGEQDRHEENWGIIIENGKYNLSPLYDNGCNLLRDFYNEENAKKYYEGAKSFEAFIKRSKAVIYKEDGSRYKHFELIKDLYKKYPEKITKEINNLNKLNDNKIDNIVNKIPPGIISEKHKEFIIRYIKRRKEILINIIREGNK